MKIYKLFFLFSLFYTIVLLCSCGEENLISSRDKLFLEQFLFANSTYESKPYLRRDPVDTVFIEQGNALHFSVAYKLNGKFVSPDSAINLYNYHLWHVENNIFNTTYLKYAFDTIGHKLVTMTTFDFFGDSLTDSIHVIVNSPLHISNLTPLVGDNQIDPISSKGIEFKWEINGIDSWEDAKCYLYLTQEKDSILVIENWLNILDSKSLLDSSNCKEPIQIKGPFLTEEWLKKNKVNLKDSSLIFYWGIKAVTKVGSIFEEKDSLFSMFSTLLAKADSSAITIHSVFYNMEKNRETPSTKIILVNANKDTLAIREINSIDTTFKINVLPQKGLHIYGYETSLKDFTADPKIIDIPYHTNVRLGMTFVDNIPPQVAPAKKAFHIKEDIKFFAIDNGSGISNSSKRMAFIDFDSVAVYYESPYISFKNPCLKECKVSIQISDNANNKSSKMYWKMNPKKDSVYITGPFVEFGE